MNELINILINNFNLAFILSVNVLTYFIIKIIKYNYGRRKIWN